MCQSSEAPDDVLVVGDRRLWGWRVREGTMTRSELSTYKWSYKEVRCCQTLAHVRRFARVAHSVCAFLKGRLRFGVWRA